MNANRNDGKDATARLHSGASDRIAPLVSAPSQIGQTSLGNFPSHPNLSPRQTGQRKETSSTHSSQKQCSSSHPDEAKHEPNKETTPSSQQPDDFPISIVDLVPIPATEPENKVPVAGQQDEDLHVHVQSPHVPKREGSASSATCCMTQEDVSESDGISCFSGSLNDFDGSPSKYRISHEICFTKYAQDHLLHLLDDIEYEGRIQRNSTDTYRLSHEVGHLSSSLAIDTEDDDSTDDTVSSHDEDDESSLAEGQVFQTSLNDDHQGSHRVEDLQESSSSSSSSSSSNRYCVSHEQGHLSHGNDLLQGLDEEEDSV